MHLNIFAKEECTLLRASTAENRLMHIEKNWDSLHRHWSVFSNCDDGLLAEGYSELVAKIILSRDSGLSRFPNNYDFETFVISHIDESIAYTDLIKIDQVSGKCNNHICRKIHFKTQLLLKSTNEEISTSIKN